MQHNSEKLTLFYFRFEHWLVLWRKVWGWSGLHWDAVGTGDPGNPNTNVAWERKTSFNLNFEARQTSHRVVHGSAGSRLGPGNNEAGVEFRLTDPTRIHQN